jgi:hypothetical protein
MTKITDPDDIRVATEITINTTAKTFTLVAAGNLVAKDGVTLQALYSKFVDLWLTSTYNKYPFPMYTIDAKSGQFLFGTDGSTYSGWKPADDTTRQMLRDGGWSEYSSAGVLNRQYVGIVSLGDCRTGAQLYYQRESGGTAYDFTFTDEANQGIQVYGDASNGNYDTRTYFKGYVREQGKKFKDSVLADTGQTATGAYVVNLLLSNEDDLKVLVADNVIASDATYTGITVEFFGSDQDRAIGGVNYPFRIIIDGNNATAEEIYTKIQYLLRQTGDIDSGAGTVVGKTAASMLSFTGDTLTTATGVYIDSYDTNDINRLVFTDQNGVARTEPYTAAGTLNFNSFLTSGGTGYYVMYFTDLASNYDYGKADAIIVDNAAGSDIMGTIDSASIAFSFAYDANVQGSRTAGTDAAVTVVAGNPGSAKPVVTTYTITRAVGQNITLTAEQDRAYLA